MPQLKKAHMQQQRPNAAKNKINKINKFILKKAIQRMDWWFPEAGLGWVKWTKRVKRCKLPVITKISPGAGMHSMVTIVNDTVLHI